jgi:EAL domain-containing protein (putative c-di-GMP-specific phosphodiesterase class I)
VCILLRKWIDSGKNPAPISVNMSRLDAYNIDVVNEIISLVKKYNVPVKLLHIEVTESAYVEDFQSLISTVKKLKEFGFKIYVDDFGTGYTSLQTLNNVSIDVIKLDQSLLINNDLRGKCIINELVQLAKSLNIKTVMEGVENCEQASFFKEIGCDYIQGYYFARPMPVNEYEILIENYENMEYYHKYNLSN